MTKEEKDLMTMALDALVDWNHSFNPGEEADKDLIAALEKCLENDAVDSEPVVWMYQNKSTHEVQFQKHMWSFVDHSAWYEIPLYSEPLANQEKTSGSPIKEALAQPEQKPVAMKFKIYKPTVPDPIRQGINNALLPWVYDQDRSSGFDATMWVTPVATLPPQRTWVGLRWSDVPDQWCGNVAFIEGGRWAEKVLKEKNYD